MTSRRRAPKDVEGVLKTQVGFRTSAPMWVRPLLTVGEWAIYTALWSFPVDSVFPTHQELADRAWCERGSAADAIARFDELKLLVREKCQREDGSDTSNTYFLVEVPTEAHLKKVAELKVERAVKQDAKRKQRKAANRRYAAKTTVGEQESEPSEAAPDGGTVQNVPPSDGGTARAVPRGSGARRTSGGTAQTEPRYGAGRTHESLGVEVLSKGTVRTSSPPTPSAVDAVESTPAQQRADPARRKTLDPSEIENQEGRITIPRDFFPDLTPWEQALHAECRRLRPEWPSAVLHKVLGMPQVRERTADNPELVWRAFMIGVNDRKRGDHQGTASPRRFLYEACPHWAAAADELRAEQERAAAGEPPASDPALVEPEQVEPAPARPAVPEQRAAARVAPVSPAAPTAAYLAEKAAQAERARARRAAAEEAEQERAERRAAALREAGVGGPIWADATLGDPVLGDLPPAPALVPAAGNAATVR